MEHEEFPHTSSIGFAAYLRLKGFKLVGHPEKGDRKYKFTFDMSRDTMDEQYREFQTSEFFNYDSIIQSLRRDLRGKQDATSKCSAR